MDVVSHAAWGATIIRTARFTWWAALVGALPDLLTFIYGIIKFRGQYNKKLDAMGHGKIVIGSYFTVYRYTHSLLPISLVTLAVVSIWPEYWYITLPYYLHIFMDIFTHQGVWATRLLYPLSDFHFAGHNWWQNKWVSLGNWAAVISINFLLLAR